MVADGEALAEMLERLGLASAPRAWEVQRGGVAVGVELAPPSWWRAARCSRSRTPFLLTRGEGTTFHVAQMLPARLVDDQALRDMVDAVARRAAAWSPR